MTTPRARFWYLRGVDVFRVLSEREVDRLAERALLRQYARGEVILRPGDPSDLVFVVKEGRAKVSAYSVEGREQILALLEPGDLFGELALVGEQESAHVEAFEDTLVCALRREDFEQILREHPEIGLHLIRALAGRLRQAAEEIENLVFRDVPGRLASVLLRLGQVYGVQDPHTGAIRVALRMTHHDLASMIGATRETVTTILARFREEGITDVEHRLMVIRQPDRLQALASGSRRGRARPEEYAPAGLRGPEEAQ